MRCRFPGTFSPTFGPEAKFYCRYHDTLDVDKFAASEVVERSQSWRPAKKADREEEINRDARKYCAERGLLRRDDEPRSAWVRRLVEYQHKKPAGIGKMHGAFQENYLRDHPSMQVREPGEDREEE